MKNFKFGMIRIIVLLLLLAVLPQVAIGQEDGGSDTDVVTIPVEDVATEDDISDLEEDVSKVREIFFAGIIALLLALFGGFGLVINKQTPQQTVVDLANNPIAMDLIERLRQDIVDAETSKQADEAIRQALVLFGLSTSPYAHLISSVLDNKPNVPYRGGSVNR